MTKKTLFTGLLTLLSFALYAQLLPNKEEEKEITFDGVSLYGTLHLPKTDQKNSFSHHNSWFRSFRQKWIRKLL